MLVIFVGISGILRKKGVEKGLLLNNFLLGISSCLVEVAPLRATFCFSFTSFLMHALEKGSENGVECGAMWRKVLNVVFGIR